MRYLHLVNRKATRQWEVSYAFTFETGVANSILSADLLLTLS
jgi:hypothetical protein